MVVAEQVDVRELVPARRGHFAFASGHHGDLWLDLDALFLWPARVRPHATALARELSAYEPQAVCGPPTGGAFLARSLAEELEVAFLPGLPGTLKDRVRGWRVVIVDDAINAGSAVHASHRVLVEAGASPVAIGALIDLGQAAFDLPYHALATMPARLWVQADCPLCRADEPLSG
jgi:orotate phosphoribosyltransferase